MYNLYCNRVQGSIEGCFQILFIKWRHSVVFSCHFLLGVCFQPLPHLRLCHSLTSCLSSFSSPTGMCLIQAYFSYRHPALYFSAWTHLLSLSFHGSYCECVILPPHPTWWTAVIDYRLGNKPHVNPPNLKFLGAQRWKTMNL